MNSVATKMLAALLAIMAPAAAEELKASAILYHNTPDYLLAGELNFTQSGLFSFVEVEAKFSDSIQPAEYVIMVHENTVLTRDCRHLGAIRRIRINLFYLLHSIEVEKAGKPVHKLSFTATLQEEQPNSIIGAALALYYKADASNSSRLGSNSKIVACGPVKPH